MKVQFKVGLNVLVQLSGTNVQLNFEGVYAVA